VLKQQGYSNISSRFSIDETAEKRLDITSIKSSVINFTKKESCEDIARGGIRIEI
jgi:hypothetical protein